MFGHRHRIGHDGAVLDFPELVGAIGGFALHRPAVEVRAVEERDPGRRLRREGDRRLNRQQDGDGVDEQGARVCHHVPCPSCAADRGRSQWQPTPGRTIQKL